MVDLTPYSASIEAARRELSKYGENVDPREGFRAELLNAGFEPPSVFELGKITRIKAPDDKQHKKSGWCILTEISMQNAEGKAIGIGVYGNWKGYPERVVWSSKNTHVMTGLESAQYHAALEAAKAQRDAELKILQATAAEQAMRLYHEAPECIDHPYLDRKKIKPVKLTRLSRESIAIPVLIDEAITSLQFILPGGEKRFLTSGKTKGAYFRIDGALDTIVICEGFATGASLYEATDATVYCAFMASNLYEVAAYAKARHVDAKIIIAGDDDKLTVGNPGRAKAQQAADALNMSAIFPECAGTDFNDMHVEHGLSAVGQMFQAAPRVYKKRASKAEAMLERPAGILGEIVDYYNATAGNEQPLFAVQSALATCSILCGRNYMTNYNNRTSLYLLNIGKSGTGKEHAKTVMEAVLDAAGMEHLIGGDGYTSDSAVISALQDRPRHIVVIDEFAKYLQAANNQYGNGMLAQANAKIMEAFGRSNGKMRPKSYANTHLPKEKRKEQVQPIYAPAITMLAMTTPDDFFDTIGLVQVKDGFLNRFLVCFSDAERSVRKYKEPIDVPESIIRWAQTIEARHGNKTEDSSGHPPPQVLNLTMDAMSMQQDLEQYKIDLANSVDRHGMSELTIRMAEIGLRCALIHALSRDPLAQAVEDQDVKWGAAYVKLHFERLIERSKMSMSSSEFESWKMDCLRAIRLTGDDGISDRELQIRKPFSKFRERDMKEIINALLKAELIFIGVRKSGNRGRPCNAYFAMEE